MLELKDEHYIAEGLERKCFYHPENNELCIKVGVPGVEEERLYREVKYYEKIRNKDTSKFTYPFFTKYYGEVATNLGTGFVYDLVKNETTEEISQTLRHYLEMENNPFSDELIMTELDRLKQEMIKHKIFVGDLRARNLCVKILKDSSIQLIVIDGLGHRDFFPFADWFHYFAKKKVERRFLKGKLHSLDAQRVLLKRLRAEGHTIV